MYNDPKIRRFRRQKTDEKISGAEPDTKPLSGKGVRPPEIKEIFKNQAAAESFLRENQKLISMGRQAASIAHEINNPLESIANLLFLLNEETDLTERAKSYLALAQQELSRVIQISKQTLNFYRDTPQPMKVHVNELMDEALLLYSRKIAEKQLHIHRQFDSPQTATAFPGGMRQVFSNLIVNAIEACPAGGSLYLRIRPSYRWADGTSGLRITIADNGTGMDAATRRTLGKPFLTTKGHQGTGLGLWVTMAILRQHGARLQSRSSTAPEKHGTVFSIFLPADTSFARVQYPFEEAS